MTASGFCALGKSKKVNKLKFINKIMCDLLLGFIAGYLMAFSENAHSIII